MREVDDIFFKVETERMLSEERFGKQATGKDGQSLDSIEDTTTAVSTAWEHEKHSFIFNPFLNEINFTERCPTDYKLNKGIILPKPLEADKEFECELRRRRFWGAFKQYKDKVGSVHLHLKLNVLVLVLSMNSLQIKLKEN